MTDDKKCAKIKKILDSMRDDVSFINQQLTIHEKLCIKFNRPLGAEWLEVGKRTSDVLMELVGMVGE